MSRSAVRLVLAMLGALLWSGAARADIFESASFSLSAGEDAGTYEFSAQVPDAVAGRAEVEWPQGCRQLSSNRQTMGRSAQLSYTFSCDRPIARDDVVRTPWSVDGATFVTNIMGAQVNRSLPAARDGIVVPIGETIVPTRPLPQIAREFTAQGVLHIWMGWDHLAFVLCLCLLARGRQLVGLITAFTLGHSVSLALAFFDVLHVPVPPVEAAIALSIAFMAREALIAGKTGEMPHDLRRHLVVVVLFGLLHGLGFATALSELGVGPGERVPGLVFFNLGVEAGQLVFVAVVAGLMAVLRALSLAVPVRTAALYGVGALGCFWMVERVAGFGMA